MIRTLWVALVAGVLTVWHAIPIMVRSRRPSERLMRDCRYHPTTWARRILRAAGVKVTLEGTEYLGSGEGCVLVANHQSWFDVFAITAYLPAEYRFVAKKELENIPFFGQAWRICGHVSLDRGDLPKAIATLRATALGMHQDRPALIMFPEGTRSVTGEMKPFKKGAFVLAIQTGMPVVPAAIFGTREVMPKGSWRIRAHPVHIRIGAPIPVEGLAHRDRDRLTRTAFEAVSRLREGAPVEGPWGLPETTS